MAAVNPETIVMAQQERNNAGYSNAAVRIEMQRYYQQKADRVGMTLDGYCNRFGVVQVWK